MTIADTHPVETEVPVSALPANQLPVELTTATVKDSYPRSVLIEGRSYGIAFAFAKLDKGVFHCVGPLSPCKDYLNDQVYTEATGKPFGAYGYHAKVEGLFKDGFAHVVMKVLPFKGGRAYNDMQHEIESMDQLYPVFAEFIAKFEGMLGLKTKTEIHKVGDYYVASIPTFWSQYTYLISLWTTLLRIALENHIKSVPSDPLSWLDDIKGTDTDKTGRVKEMISAMSKGKVPVQDWNQSRFWHDEGMMTFNFSA